jgi:iron-sulfur cluster repair protein YtfE (RIC family)
MKTKSYRDQHDRLLSMASDISGLLAQASSEDKAKEIRSLLSKLFGVLKVHLSTEDRLLYPKLIEIGGTSGSTAKTFQDEMGGIGEVIAGYNTKWSSAKKIQEDPKTFSTETKGLFKALATRIKRENETLYPLFDAS